MMRPGLKWPSRSCHSRTSPLSAAATALSALSDGTERALGVETETALGGVERDGVAGGERQKIAPVELDSDAVAFEKATDTEQPLGQSRHDRHSPEANRGDDRLIALLAGTPGGSKSFDSQGDGTNGSDGANDSIRNGDLAPRVVISHVVELTSVKDEVL